MIFKQIFSARRILPGGARLTLMAALVALGGCAFMRHDAEEPSSTPPPPASENVMPASEPQTATEAVAAAPAEPETETATRGRPVALQAAGGDRRERRILDVG